MQSITPYIKSAFLLVFLLLIERSSHTEALARSSLLKSSDSRSPSCIHCRSSDENSGPAKLTLDERTLWRLSFEFKKDGCKASQAVANVRFVEDRGYEPPQGRLFVEDDFNGLIRVDDKGYSTFSWTLSEDKDDRKDGLWVYGLWKEPKYPFLYFSIGIFESVVLPNGEEELIWGKGVPGSKLSIRFNHEITKEMGTTLSNPMMMYKESEFMKADPLGVGGVVDIGDDVCAGNIQIRPVYK